MPPLPTDLRLAALTVFGLLILKGPEIIEALRRLIETWRGRQ